MLHNRRDLGSKLGRKKPNVLNKFSEVSWDSTVKYAPPSTAIAFEINSSQTILSPVASKPENRKRDSINTFVEFLNAFLRSKLLTQTCTNGDEYIHD
jgi:hypothetical protein